MSDNRVADPTNHFVNQRGTEDGAAVIAGLDPLGYPRETQTNINGDLYETVRVFKTDLMPIPGIGTGAAYAAADAFGTKFAFNVPVEGTIANIIFHDFDDEGLVKEFVLFNADFTGTADNSAFAVTDDDLRKCIGVVIVNDYKNYGVNQLGQGTPALTYVAPAGQLWCQVVTQGADNIAAGSIPEFFMVIV